MKKFAYGIFFLILIGLMVNFYFNPLGKLKASRDEQRKSDLSHIQKALEKYYSDKGFYPKSFGLAQDCNTDHDIVGTLHLQGCPVAWGSANFPPYMDKVPKDPLSSQSYYYYSSDGQSYYLYASLEVSGNTDGCNGGNPCQSLDTNKIETNACGGICNYGISSPNTTP